MDRVEIKDVRLPQQLQRAMAAEAEAAREARAKVIAAEGEHQASRSLANAAEVITSSPAALQVSSLSFAFPALHIAYCNPPPYPIVSERNDNFCPLEQHRRKAWPVTCEVKPETDPKIRNALATRSGYQYQEFHL